MTSAPAEPASRMAEAAAAFERHLELDEGVLATTAPLETSALDNVLLLVAAGLAPVKPALEQRVGELRERLMTQRVIGAAEAVASMLELLVQHKPAEEFFKASIVHVLTGEKLSLRTPDFGGGQKPTAAAAATTTTATNGGSAATPSIPSVPVAAASSAETVAVASTAMNETADSETKAPVAPTPTPAPQPAAAAAASASAAEVEAHSSDSASSPPSPPQPAPPIPSPSPICSRDSPSLLAGGAPPVQSQTQNFAPLPGSSSVTESPARRKRSVDSLTYSPKSEPLDSERQSKRKMAPGSNAHASALHGQQYVVKDRNDPSLHPTFSVPTQWEELHFKPVQVINVNAPGAKDQIQALRMASTPFILEGYTGWMKFADDWVRPNGSLDSEAFMRGLHDVKVPVIEKNYEDTNPIKSHVALSHYVRNYWDKGKADYYLHQWQFPLLPKAAKLLCYKCEELPVLGDNLLLYWLDSVRGDNPLQYFFMGQRSTTSRMHQDPGGLDITITPIVGTKRVTMLHKSAAKIDSVHDQINFHEVNLDKMPLLAFIPAWRVDIKPGQMLFMPEGTFHACENITACLSYHRFHVDAVNMPGFLASFMAQDSPSINHAEILWNAVHDVIASLEEIFHANGTSIGDDVYTLRKLDTLRALRHASRVLSLEESLPTADSWDWNKLLEDIDQLLVRIDPTAPSQNSQQKKKARTARPVETVTLLDDSDEEDTKTTSAPAATAFFTPKPTSQAATTSAPVANALARGKKTLSTHWDELKLKVGDTIGVQVYEKRNKAQVMKIALNVELVQVHYVDWGSIYDEFLPLSSLYQRSTRSSKRVQYRKPPKVHEAVLAKWGTTGQLYNAIVLKVIRSNACFVHYLKYESDWDQWVLPGHIFKKYGAKDGSGDDAVSS